ncbi:hypothetical protein GCM10007036_21200 [Alsobacter metallidurans]|uniref:Uncharacterized protein n=1 Tax=Alsobacter metallidurans TaxID=340221 RepID=A0A917MHN4_9HYPH|nr:hypothetical protein GCM10007036_21200 [Alsobacter metallidurans]
MSAKGHERAFGHSGAADLSWRAELRLPEILDQTGVCLNCMDGRGPIVMHLSDPSVSMLQQRTGQMRVLPGVYCKR